MPQVTQSEFMAGVQSGEVVSFPTDTVPALAALPAYADRIFAVKQRSPEKPLILMAATVEDLFPYLLGTPPEFTQWEAMMQKYWPGALTLVLPASSQVPIAMNPLDPTTLGVRIPHSAIALEILRQTGPLATTSANLSGEPPLETLSSIAATFPEVLTLSRPDLPADIPTGNGKPSTVAKWTRDGWQILRQGTVTLTDEDIKHE